MKPVQWKIAPDDHDFPAAAAYLSLLASTEEAAGLVAALRAAPLTHHRAKDILRAGGLALLSDDNAHVAADLDKIRDGKSISPVLIVRGDLASGRPLQIADGYHRVCASYHYDENTDIPCVVAPSALAYPAPSSH